MENTINVKMLAISDYIYSGQRNRQLLLFIKINIPYLYYFENMSGFVENEDFNTFYKLVTSLQDY